MFWGAHFLFFFFKYCSVRTEKLLKMMLKKSYIFFLNLDIKFKLELSPQNFHNEPLLWLHLGSAFFICA